MPEERSAGYGVIGHSFASGDSLALWRCSASSSGAPYTAVWHRNPGGVWTLFADVGPERAVLPLFAPSPGPVVTDMIAVNWTGPSHLVVTVRDAGLVWSVELATTGATRMLSALTGRLPGRWWRECRALHWIGPTAGWALGLGSVRLCGRTSGGLRVRLSPRTIRRARTTRAAVRGRDLGPAREESRQVRLGDFRIPARGVFAAGEMCVEAVTSSQWRGRP
ncbi:MAG TPA: hypothetical protein VIV56_10695 [Gemmatimonadales bacterium]